MRCHSCSNQRLRHTRYCMTCYIMDCVRKTLDIKDKPTKERYTKQLLDKLEKQNYMCVYTARVLVAGKNLSLDHILPKSVYPEGLRDLDNLVWVDKAVNIAKNNLLPSNFLELCEDVVFHQSKYLTKETSL